MTLDYDKLLNWLNESNNPGDYCLIERRSINMSVEDPGNSARYQDLSFLDSLIYYKKAATLKYVLFLYYNNLITRVRVNIDRTPKFEINNKYYYFT